MRRKRFQPRINTNHEFELDLAPLLAVMVKLVPVMLISSAFVQLMVVETDLPQIVKDSIKQEDENKNPTSIQLELSKKSGMKIVVSKNGEDKEEKIPLKKEGQFDFQELHAKLQTIKNSNPDVFKLELAPEADVPLNDIVKSMDEARKSRNKKVTFPVVDKKTGKESETDYMFPNVVFVNMTEGGS